MTITIQKFRIEPYGLFLDYKDCPAGVAVNRQTGNVDLSDSPWDPTPTAGVVGMIESNEIINFQTHQLGSGTSSLELHCMFGSEAKETVYQLGETLNGDELAVWLTAANSLYLSARASSVEVDRPQKAPNNRYQKNQYDRAAEVTGPVGRLSPPNTANQHQPIQKPELDKEGRRATG